MVESVYKSRLIGLLPLRGTPQSGSRRAVAEQHRVCRNPVLLNVISDGEHWGMPIDRGLVEKLHLDHEGKAPSLGVRHERERSDEAIELRPVLRHKHP